MKHVFSTYNKNKNEIPKDILRGDMLMVRLNSSQHGSEQTGIRPVIVVSNNTGNHFSEILMVIPLTSQKKAKIPTHVCIDENNIEFTQYQKIVPSTILCEQIITIARDRVLRKFGNVKPPKMEEINKAIKIALEL